MYEALMRLEELPLLTSRLHGALDGEEHGAYR